ncbi:MAG: DUF362 domain-containing protein [Bacillota bacterium]
MEMENVVSLRGCGDYSEDNVRSAIEGVFAPFGGISAVVKSGDNVYLKLNFVSGKEPSRAVTTHPMITRVVAKMCLECGASVVCGDSSGGLYNKAHMSKVYKITGTEDAIADLDATMNEDFGSTIIPVAGKVATELEVTDSVLKADVVINLAKLKTHTLTRYTGAVKNLFGIIPGLKKVSVHGEYQSLDRFFDYLFDINIAVKDKVAFHIVDGVMAMEGEGPTAGDVKKMGVIFGGKNPFAVDYIGTSLIGEVENFPQNGYASERGLLDVSAVEVVGEKVADYKKEFEIPAPRPDANLFDKYPKFVTKLIKKLYMTYPAVAKQDCRGCQKCAKHCPPKAIDMSSGKAVFDYDKCIRCFCCQELCPFGVIKIKKPIGARVLAKRKAKKN